MFFKFIAYFFSIGAEELVPGKKSNLKKETSKIIWRDKKQKPNKLEWKLDKNKFHEEKSTLKKSNFSAPCL